MILTPRLYVPLDAYRQRITLDPGQRIAYYARSFEWVDDERQPNDALGFYDEHTDRIAEIFSQIDELAEKEGECERRNMGCIVTSLTLIEMSRGVNIKPDGMKGNCREIGCIPAVTCRLTLHAEQTALNKMSTKPFTPIERHFGLDKTFALFNTAVPCLDCMKVCRAHRVSLVFYKDERDQPEYDRPIMSAITMSGKIRFVKVSENR